MAVNRKQTVIHLNGTSKSEISYDKLKEGEIIVLHPSTGGAEFGTRNNTNIVWFKDYDSTKVYVDSEVGKVSDKVTELEALTGITTSALQEIITGDSGEYVTTSIGKKTVENTQSVSVAVKVQAVSGASETNKGLAEASDVKTYVDAAAESVNGKISAVDAKIGSGFTTDSTVSAQLNAVKKTADSALQSISASNTDGGYITTTVSEKGDKTTQSVSVNATVQTVSGASETNKGLAEASDVKTYVDAKTSDLATAVQSVSGNTYVAAAKSGTSVTLSTSVATTLSGITEVGQLADAKAAKDYVDDEIKKNVASVYKVKGTKENYSDLPTSGNTIGDVWNVTNANDKTPAGTNYVYTDNGWDALGGTIDLSPYAVTENLKYDDKAVDKNFVTAVSEENGIITVARRELSADDVPTLNIEKITNLSTSLDGKVDKATTVNNKALNGNITLDGADINVGGNGEHSGKTLDVAVSDIYAKITAAASGGVLSFGGKTGDITLAETSDANGSVNLSMDNNTLGASIIGLKTAAYQDKTDFASAEQGKKADSAVQSVTVTNTDTNNITATIDDNKTVTLNFDTMIIDCGTF